MLRFIRSKVKNARVDWKLAPDVSESLLRLSLALKLDYLDISRVSCYRSHNSKARAYARIWGLGRLWQMELNQKPRYIIEVISEKYDRLDENQKDKVIMHEIAHIPKNFSGSLMPHIKKRGKRNFHDKVDEFVDKYLKESGL